MSLGAGLSYFTYLRVDKIFCTCMVRGGGDIFFQAINTGGGGDQNKFEEVDCFGNKDGVTLFSDTEWELNFFHTSLTHIFNKCHKNAVFCNSCCTS